MDKKDIVHALAAMTESEYQDTVAEARGNDPQVLKEAAAAALRRKARGANVTELNAKSVEDSRAALDAIFRRD